MAYEYTRLGQANLQGDTEALFRDKFIPLLLTRFDELRVIKPLVRNKTITSGKSASFPLFGKMGAKYMGIGDKCIGNQKINKNETTIMIDPYLVADTVLYDLEEKMSETDDRAIIADEMAKALANTEDRQLLQLGCLAARSDSFLDDGYGGTVLQTENAAYDGRQLAEAIYTAGVVLDTKDVPNADRYAFVRPLQYSILAQFEDIKNHDIGSGSFSEGTTGKLNNIKVIKTNHLPSTDVVNPEDSVLPRNLYTGDFSHTAALVMTKEAIATVTLQGLITEVSWDSRYFHHLLTARVAQGHGILRPECAVEIQSDNMGGGEDGLNASQLKYSSYVRLSGGGGEEENPEQGGDDTIEGGT